MRRLPLAIHLNSLGCTLSDSGYFSYFSAAVNRHDQSNLIKVFTWDSLTFSEDESMIIVAESSEAVDEALYLIHIEKTEREQD